MRKLPTIIAIIFLILPLNRVAYFGVNVIGETNLINAWAFSLGIAGIIFVTSYFNRTWDERKKRNSQDETKFETRKSELVRVNSMRIMYLFIVIDGVINTAKVWNDRKSNDFLVLIGVLVYGLTPTFAMALMGRLQGMIDQLPKTIAQVDLWKLIKSKLIRSLSNGKPKNKKPVQTVKRQNQQTVKSAPIVQNEKDNLEQFFKSVNQQNKQVEQDVEMDEQELELYNLIKENGNTSKSDYAKKMKISRGTVYNIKARLIEKDFINKNWKILK